MSVARDMSLLCPASISVPCSSSTYLHHLSLCSTCKPCRHGRPSPRPSFCSGAGRRSSPLEQGALPSCRMCPWCPLAPAKLVLLVVIPDGDAAQRISSPDISLGFHQDLRTPNCLPLHRIGR